MNIEDLVNVKWLYNAVWNFADGSDAATEYEYDENGNVTKDLNKKILHIDYNLLNLPAFMVFSYGNMSYYTYTADGKKVRAEYESNLLSPLSETSSESADDYFAQDSISLASSTYKVIDYVGNLVYEDDVLTQMLIEGGYVTFDGNNAPTYHFYLQDHLGNNRVVVNQNGSIEQVNHYYPYGALMAESTGDDVQRYRYNGKELDRMHGLDWHDYGARWNNNILGLWTTVDPLCEKFPDINPYLYCKGNPIKYLDSDGLRPGDFFKTINAAAIDFGMYYNDNSIRMNREMSSTIIHIKDSNGNAGFTYTIANVGNSQEVGLIYEPGSKLAATIHSHAAYTKDADVNNNNFSGMYNKFNVTNSNIRLNSTEGDIANANQRGVPSFVTTPGGSLKRYDPQNGKISVISNSLPSDANDPQRMNIVEIDEKNSQSLADLLEMQNKIREGVQNNITK